MPQNPGNFAQPTPTKFFNQPGQNSGPSTGNPGGIDTTSPSPLQKDGRGALGKLAANKPDSQPSRDTSRTPQAIPAAQPSDTSEDAERQSANNSAASPR